MKNLDIEQLQAEKYPSISMIVPSDRISLSCEQERIQLKNLIKRCEQLLQQDQSLSKQEVQSLVAKLTDHADSIDFQSVAAGGLAIFANSALVKSYELSCPVSERLTIASQFATTELMQSFDRSLRYLVLVISEPLARLLVGQNSTLIDNHPGAFPLEHIAHESPSQRMVSSAPAGSGWEVRTGGKAGPLPGTYVPDIESYREERLRRFFRRVDEALSAVVEDECLPVFVIGTRRNLDEFQSVTLNSSAIGGVLEGSYDHASVSEVQEIIEPVVVNYLKSIKSKKLLALDEARSRKRATSGLSDCLQSALEGRCQTLVVEESFLNESDPGNESNKQSLKDVAINDVDKTVEAVIKHRGEIVFVEPGSLEEFGHIAAITRY